MNSENENMLSDLGDLTFYGDFSILPFDIATLNPNQYTQLALNTDKSLQLGFIQSQLPNLFGGQIAANAYIKISKRFTSYSYEIESGRYGNHAYEC